MGVKWAGIDGRACSSSGDASRLLRRVSSLSIASTCVESCARHQVHILDSKEVAVGLPYGLAIWVSYSAV